MRTRSRWTSAVGALSVIVIGVVGCAITRPSADPWTTYYDGSPDDVWTAIHIALVDLGYEVETENREDGVVTAIRTPAQGIDGGVLSIDQRMPNQEVKVYVRAAAAPGGTALGFDQQQALAKEFLAAVNDILYK